MYTPKRNTWFLVADGAKMRLFESVGAKEPWVLIGEDAADDARKAARELGSERPGRGRKAGSGARIAMEAPAQDEKLEDAFVHRLAGKLNDANRDGLYDQLVLALSPRALGELRKKLAPEVTAKLIGVFDKGLTQISDADLLAYFKERLTKW